MSRKLQEWLAYAILLICGFLLVTHGFRDERHRLQSLDFKTVYGGARCLLHDCDPYDSQQIYTAYLQAGGLTGQDMRAFRPHEPLYMPSALALLTPFALLRWWPAHLVWLVFSTGIYLIGVTLIARLCFRLAPLPSAVGIGLLLLTNTILIELAQPAQLTVGLCAIAVWCLLEHRYPVLGTICFAIALVFKPHDCGPIWLYFALCRGEYRRQALRIFVVTVLLCIPGIVWASLLPASAHWLGEIRGNMAALSMHGKINDPGPTNVDAPLMGGLQGILSVLRDKPVFYNSVAWAVALALLAIWSATTFRMKPSRERDYLAIASILCVSMMPVYHRNYDMALLLFIFPAFALFWTQTAKMRITATVVTLLSIGAVADNFELDVKRFVLPHLGTLTKCETILWTRPVPVFTLLLTIFYLTGEYLWARREQESRIAEERVLAEAG